MLIHLTTARFLSQTLQLSAHMCVLKGKGMSVPSGKRSINPDTFNTWWQSEKDQERSEATSAFLSAPYHPCAFCPFPGLSLKNYRITLLQSLSKHRQIPHQAWPQLWQDDLCCTATGSVRCPSELSPSSHLHTCPACVNDQSFDKQVFFFKWTRRIIRDGLMRRKCQ